jgi:hypothetical protein
MIKVNYCLAGRAYDFVPATMANMHDVILKRVAFGSVRGL